MQSSRISSKLSSLASNRLGGDVLAKYESILSTTIANKWDVRAGVTSASSAMSAWTDSIGSVSLVPNGGSNPTFAADGSHFNGLPVLQTSAAPAKYMRKDAVTLAASGSRPWIFLVFRYLSVIDNDQCLCDLGVLGTDDLLNLQRRSGTSFRASQNNLTSGPYATGPAVDTKQHMAWYGSDGVNLNLRMDGTLYQVAQTAALPKAATSFALGATAPGDFWTTSTAFALALICSSQPSAAQLAAVEQLALRDFGAVG